MKLKRILAALVAFMLIISLAIIPSVAIIHDFVEPGSKGDANCDGKINLHDVANILQYVADWNMENGSFSEVAADINSDGKANMIDAIHIIRYVMSGLYGPC